MKDFTLQDLNEIIAARSLEGADVSYTSTLLSAGTEKCAKKFGEEPIEAIIAATSGDKVELVKQPAEGHCCARLSRSFRRSCRFFPGTNSSTNYTGSH